MMYETLARPNQAEYIPYYGRYISLVPEGEIVTVLGSQIAETLALLGSITESQADFRYATDKWSVKELVGHVIDAERIFAYRALRFARSDATPLPGYEQDDYVRSAPFGRWPLSDLASEFECVRASSLFLFRHLDRTAWMRKGLANDSEVSVRALAYIIAGHELHHREILRSRYLSALATSPTKIK